MHDHSPTPRLGVIRTFADGKRAPAGELAQNRQGVYFRYAPEYLTHHPSLSPFDPPEDTALHRAAKEPHSGLHGVFADSLPDSWGRELMETVCVNQDISRLQLSGLDRLAYAGDRSVGALSYSPRAQLLPNELDGRCRLRAIGFAAQAVHEGRLKEALDQLPDILDARDSRSKSGLYLELLSSVAHAGGARPKAQLYLAGDGLHCSTAPAPGMTPHLVKFTSARFPLGHEEGVCEAAYLTLAARAGIETPDWRLLEADTPAGRRRWLAQVRFDRCPAGPGDDAYSGRLHFLSACGLLDADFRAPTLDYEDLIKAAGMLCGGAAASQQIFRRAAFNLFACNQDDHSRNWGFLQGDDGRWSLAPFYDATYSPHPYGEHATAYAGRGRRPPLNAMQALADHAGFASWPRAREALEEAADAVAQWPEVADALEIRRETRLAVDKALKQTRQENRRLLSPDP